MKKTGQFSIDAAKEEVWSVFMDPKKLGACIPGCKKIKGISPTQYEALVEVKVPLFPLKIEAVGELKEAKEYEKLIVEMKGKPVSIQGSFTNTLTVYLKSAGRKKTTVNYEMDFQINGKLAPFGELLMKGSNSKNSNEFVKNVQGLFS